MARHFAERTLSRLRIGGFGPQGGIRATVSTHGWRPLASLDDGWHARGLGAQRSRAVLSRCVEQTHSRAGPDVRADLYPWEPGQTLRNPLRRAQSFPALRRVI